MEDAMVLDNRIFLDISKIIEKVTYLRSLHVM